MPTRAEEMLWLHLRAGRLDGLKFRRQVPIGPFIADFTCFEARLIVELDGPLHDDPVQREHDENRNGWLRSQGFNILRFANDLVLGGGGDLVIEAVRQATTIRRASPPSSDPC